MMTEDFDFKNDVKIDCNNLEAGCEEQPSLFLYYSQNLAEAKAEKDRLSEKLKIMMADVELKKRKDPPKDLKVTESVIKSIVESDEDIVKLKNELNEAKKYVYYLEAACDALDHRKRMLDNLVSLVIKGYYQTPTGSYTSYDEDASRNLNKSLNNKKEA